MMKYSNVDYAQLNTILPIVHLFEFQVRDSTY